MDYKTAITEVEWYHTLVKRKIREWGLELNKDARDLLLGNMEEIAERHDKLQFKALKDGYYIGELDEEGLRNGFGITTHTTKNRNRWVMQAGEWHEDLAQGWHTLYDSDCPEAKHFLALVKFKGERKSENGKIEFSIAEYGSNFTPRKYRRYSGFSWSTLVVGLSIVFFALFFITRRVRLSLIGCAAVAIFYTIGALRERQ
ncbi:MAG: hypothetical protein II299_07010 [Alistipes sp.]|nr:hypothetical protein [Alistipes sp.]